MKISSDYILFSTKGEFDFIDLTGRISEIVKKSGVNEGIALIFAGHATGVIVITENESRLRKDIKDLLERLFPSDRRYFHYENAYAHLRSMFLTPSKVVPVRGGNIALGTWQSILWIEVERRPRQRKVEVYVIGE